MPEPEAGPGPRLFAVPGWMRRHTPLLSRLIEQLAAVRVLDCATRLAAQAFLGAVPALFVIGALAPDWLQQQLVSSIRTTLGLQDAALDQVRSVYSATDPTALAGTSGVGIVVTLLSATACSRALQRTCERAWHLPKAGARIAAWRWLVWLPFRQVGGDLRPVDPYADGLGGAVHGGRLDRRVRGERGDRGHVTAVVEHDVVHPDGEEGDRYEEAGERDQDGGRGARGDPPRSRRLTHGPPGDGGGGAPHPSIGRSPGRERPPGCAHRRAPDSAGALTALGGAPERGVDALGLFQLVLEDDDAAGGLDGSALVDELPGAGGDAQLVAGVPAVSALGPERGDQAGLSDGPEEAGGGAEQFGRPAHRVGGVVVVVEPAAERVVSCHLHLFVGTRRGAAARCGTRPRRKYNTIRPDGAVHRIRFHVEA